MKSRNIQLVTKQHVIRALDDERTVFEALQGCPINRSFPQQKHLTVPTVNALMHALQNGNILLDHDDPGIELCYRRGLLHSEITKPGPLNAVCVFPTRLHEKYFCSFYMHIICICANPARYIEFYLANWKPQPFAFDKYPSITQLCSTILGRFSGKNLMHCLEGKLSTAAKLRPPEAQYQDEFYRAFTSLLGNGVPISSEWSQPGDGRIDFRVIEPAWGFELLREGDRLAEHCHRFKAGGDILLLDPERPPQRLDYFGLQDLTP